MDSRLAMVLYVMKRNRVFEVACADSCDVRFCSLWTLSLCRSCSRSLRCMLSISLVGLLSQPLCLSTTSGLLLRLKAWLATFSTTTLS